MVNTFEDVWCTYSSTEMEAFYTETINVTLKQVMITAITNGTVHVKFTPRKMHALP